MFASESSHASSFKNSWICESLKPQPTKKCTTRLHALGSEDAISLKGKKKELKHVLQINKIHFDLWLCVFFFPPLQSQNKFVVTKMQSSCILLASVTEGDSLIFRFYSQTVKSHAVALADVYRHYNKHCITSFSKPVGTMCKM